MFKVKKTMLGSIETSVMNVVCLTWLLDIIVLRKINVIILFDWKNV